MAGYSGTAGDSLTSEDFGGTRVHNNQPFTTRDRDNDNDGGGNCAQRHTGAWWYNACHLSNLNGFYFPTPTINSDGVIWFYFHNTFESLKFSEMKLRRA